MDRMCHSSRPDINSENKNAWDGLYASTAELIWGRAPIPFLKEFLPEPSKLPAGGVLDAATGEGRNLPMLLGLGRAVAACDSSSAAVAKIPIPVASRIKLLVCDLDRVPLPDASQAFILLSDVVETLPEPGPVFMELRRLLVPGGYLLANIPDESDGVAGVDMVPVNGSGWLYRGKFFYRFHTRVEAEVLITKAGLDVATCSERAWKEPSHPNFREHSHRHRSRVFLVRRPL